MRLSLPSKDAVRTAATFTLNTLSTALRISTLLASGRTRKVTVLSSSFCRMLFSVMIGRRMTVRGSRFTQRLLEGSQRLALEHDLARPQELIHRDMRRRFHGQPGNVARRPRHDLGHALQDEQRRHRPQPERAEARDEALGLAVDGAEALDHGHAAIGDPRRHRRAQGPATHRPRQGLLVAPRRGTERLAAALPLRPADRSLAPAAGALLLPGLLAAARDLAAPLRIVCARPAIGELARDGLMQEGDPDLDAEHVGFELERSRRLARGVEHVHGG